MKVLIEQKMNSTENLTYSLLYKCWFNSKFDKSIFLNILEENAPKNYKWLDYKGDYNILIDIT